MISVEDRIRKLNETLGKIDNRLFELKEVYENFFGEFVAVVHINRMVKASYLSLKKIADITGAKDILIEKLEGDNLVEIKLLIPLLCHIK